MTTVADTAVRHESTVESAAVEPRAARDLLVLIAAFLPALGAAVFKVFVHPPPVLGLLLRPETFYFHDGLRLLSGHAPLDFTNPGHTPPAPQRRHRSADRARRPRTSTASA